MIDISGKPKTGRPKKASYREGRSKQLNIRLSEQDLKNLDKLASFYGITRTDYILMAIEDGIKEMNKIKKEIGR